MNKHLDRWDSFRDWRQGNTGDMIRHACHSRHQPRVDWESLIVNSGHTAFTMNDSGKPWSRMEALSSPEIGWLMEHIDKVQWYHSVQTFEHGLVNARQTIQPVQLMKQWSIDIHDQCQPHRALDRWNLLNRCDADECFVRGQGMMSLTEEQISLEADAAPWTSLAFTTR